MCRAGGGRGSGRAVFLWNGEQLFSNWARLGLLWRCVCEGLGDVPCESVVGVQCCGVLAIGPLWFMRAGSRFGVAFFESVECIDSIVRGVCFCVRFWRGVECFLGLCGHYDFNKLNYGWRLLKLVLLLRASVVRRC